MLLFVLDTMTCTGWDQESEAATRPTMRFVAIKSPEQQSILALHRTRDLLIRQRTQLVNMIRAQLAEFGIVLAKGIQHALRLAGQLVEGAVPDIPPLAVDVIVTLAEQLRDLEWRRAIAAGWWGDRDAADQRPQRLAGLGLGLRFGVVLGTFRLGFGPYRRIASLALAKPRVTEQAEPSDLHAGARADKQEPNKRAGDPATTAEEQRLT